METIDKIKEIFKSYTDSYEKSSRTILKIRHTLRVADNCYEIAKGLNLSNDDTVLAYLIGICHDIGRFEQVKNFDSFNDKACGIDHADYSNKVLFEDKLIDKFLVDKSLHSLIKIAVYYHNKKDVPNNLSDRELLFCNIIRDADKLDILYALITDSLEDLFWYDDFDVIKISDEALETLYKEDLIPYSAVKTNADQIVVFYGYIFDLNFKKSYLKINHEKYYDIFTKRLYKKFSSKKLAKQIEEINNYINNFIYNKIK